MDLTKLISEFVGNQNVMKDNIQRCLVKLMGISRDLKKRTPRRSPKHIAKGIDLAVGSICNAMNDFFFLELLSFVH